ncbi:MAG: PIN domain-containing protein [Magnetococcales bacterium]|nr:PIN domain-containing protein [Magnetococcales bacterium]
MKVVLHPNVLKAALTSTGASHRLLEELPSMKFDIQMSAPLLLEYEATLTRRCVPLEDLNIVLGVIAAFSYATKLHYLWLPILPNVTDDMVLELAVESKTEIIITLDKKDFLLAKERVDIRIMTPREFWHLLWEQRK